jgi:AAA+ superfamily predicted ATPase
MTDTMTDKWYETNQLHLMTAVGEVREELEHYMSCLQRGEPKQGLPRSEAPSGLDSSAALETVTTAFGLSAFERKILLMCAGVELDSAFARLCASLHGGAGHPHLTFSLALAALSDAHWSALSPARPLRYWRLIEVGKGSLLTNSQLRIDERILHYLAGISYTDERLAGFTEPLPPGGDMVPSRRAVADRLVRAWSNRGRISRLPIVQLCGADAGGKRAVAAAACSELGLNLTAVAGRALPVDPSELEALIRLWQREAVLEGSVLLLDCDDAKDCGTERRGAVRRFCDRLNGGLIVTSNVRTSLGRRPMLVLEVGKPMRREQRVLWETYLGSDGDRLNDELEEVVSQFNMSREAIHSVSSEVLGFRMTPEAGRYQDPDGLVKMVWDTCRLHTRPALDNLAQRMKPAATWDDLVLPEAQKRILREIAMHVRQRSKVYDTWGFAAQSERGLGISVLFSGGSGTGKTMASEVLANELRLDLYRIDLSQVVSKYIGETEKNLGRVFDAAEDGGAILLFDEADSLFGKRSEVRDSHDRYANIEVSYLLQRMEAYSGLAILTTNMKSALDKAFLRRIRFLVDFPFPSVAHRAEIWTRIFPSATPAESVDVEKLARLNITGGNIRNIALNAAFLAADEGGPVCMWHLSRAARTEYTKIEKPLSSAEIGEWE